MQTWTLTIAAAAAISEPPSSAPATTPNTRARQLFAAAAALIGRADIDERPRYTLHLGGQLVAIMQTGDDEFGLPDHAGAADLLGRMQQTRIPFGS